jgi:NADH dehydrogenase
MDKPRIVIVGAGFAGFHAARRLGRLAKGRAEIILVNPTDYFLYVPLLPEVATGILEPRRLTVSIADTLPDVRLVLGQVDGLDLDSRTVQYADPAGARGELSYDRLVIAAGASTNSCPFPGSPSTRTVSVGFPRPSSSATT